MKINALAKYAKIHVRGMSGIYIFILFRKILFSSNMKIRHFTVIIEIVIQI